MTTTTGQHLSNFINYTGCHRNDPLIPFLSPSCSYACGYQRHGIKRLPEITENLQPNKGVLISIAQITGCCAHRLDCGAVGTVGLSHSQNVCKGYARGYETLL